MRSLVLSIFVAVLSVGCAKQTEQKGEVPDFPVPELAEERVEWLDNFPLLDQDGKMKPPIASGSKEWPLGVIVYMPPGGRGGFCSASHIGSGRVAANAHCIFKDSKPYDYFIIYYDKTGTKQFDRVKSFEYVGDSEKDDIAVVRMAKTREKDWHVLGGKVVPSQDEVGAWPSQAHKVTVWSFNPLRANHPDLFDEYGSDGMKFTPKQCLASRTQPRAVALRLDEDDKIVGRMRIVSKAKENLHIFVDDCDQRVVKGNSGSLISMQNDFHRVFGVYHWGVNAEGISPIQFQKMTYEGNAGEKREFETKTFNGELFGVGTAFESAFKDIPELLTLFMMFTFDVP